MREEMPVEASEDSESGGATKTLQAAGQALQKAAEVINSSPATTEKDRAKMSEVLNGFIELVESNLSGAPGEDAPEPEPEVPSAVPMEGGLKGVPAGPNQRM